MNGQKGATLLDTVVGVALMLVVFLGIYATFQLSIDVISNNKARAGAIALAGARMEYLRSLPYDQVGTAGGIPSGTVPQIETVSQNGVNYTRRTLVRYADDPKDGSGAADQNSITADYREVRVELSWIARTGARSVVVAGRISPPGIEQAVSGGTLSIIAVNASALPVMDAQVRIYNPGLNPQVDVTTYTNASGTVSFIGAPAGSGYQITVSKTGYSTARTYDATAQNTNPTPGHLTVVNNQTTQATFAIDVLGSITVYTYKQIQTGTWQDLFTDSTKIATTTSTEVSGGRLRFSGNPPYPPEGTAQSVAIAPSLLYGWKQLTWNDVEPTETEVFYQIRTFDGAQLIPDSVLPGNSLGFSTSPVNLSTISTTTYPGIRLGAILKTKNPGAPTPSIDDWSVTYDYGPEPLLNLSFSLRGDKQVGSGPSGTLYKYNQVHSSGDYAGIVLNSMEWDNYTITVDGAATNYDIASSCGPQPQWLSPGASLTTRLYMATHTSNSLLIDVRNAAGDLLQNASARLQKNSSGYDQTKTTDGCGQAFFGGLTAGGQGQGNSYSITVTAVGYQPYSATGVEVSGQSRLSVELNP